MSTFLKLFLTFTFLWVIIGWPILGKDPGEVFLAGMLGGLLYSAIMTFWLSKRKK